MRIANFVFRGRDFQEFIVDSRGETSAEMSADIICDQIHFRHDSKWSGRLGPAEGGGVLLCVACVIEMIESEEIAVRNTMINIYYLLIM